MRSAFSASCQEYLVEMGVDPRAWIKAMRDLEKQPLRLHASKS